MNPTYHPSDIPMDTDFDQLLSAWSDTDQTQSFEDYCAEQYYQSYLSK